MAFKGITFAGQNVTPKNDGGLYQAHYGDGILWGCSMAISGDDLVIQSGEFIAGGRVCFVDGATNIDLSGRVNNTGYIQVIMNYDLSQGEGSQWYTSFVESATTTFPDLTKDDINDTGTLYQVALAIVQVSGGNLTSIYSSMEYSYVYVTNGSEYGTFFTSSGGSTTMRGFDSSGNILGGIHAGSSGTVVVYGNGSGNIYMRPNGVSSTVNQVFLDTSGQLHGGILIDTNTPNDTNITANSWNNISGFTGLSSSGVYMAYGSCDYTPSANTEHAPAILIGGNTSSEVRARNSAYSNNQYAKFLSASCVFTGLTAIYMYVSTRTAGITATASAIRFEIVRLA